MPEGAPKSLTGAFAWRLMTLTTLAFHMTSHDYLQTPDIVQRKGSKGYNGIPLGHAMNPSHTDHRAGGEKRGSDER